MEGFYRPCLEAFISARSNASVILAGSFSGVWIACYFGVGRSDSQEVSFLLF